MLSQATIAIWSTSGPPPRNIFAKSASGTRYLPFVTAIGTDPERETSIARRSTFRAGSQRPRDVPLALPRLIFLAPFTPVW